MNIQDERYIITTRKTPIKFSADNRNQFYRSGDLTELINDAYKFIEEQDAKDYLTKNLFPYEDFEVRKVNVTYEVN